MKQARVGIINVTGYAGMELARLLAQHPYVQIASVTGRSAAGQRLSRFFPHLVGMDQLIEPNLGDVDLVFSAMPHKESAPDIIPLVARGIKAIDISADFRLKNAELYPEWYGFTHPAPRLLEEAIYGLPELYRDRIVKARIVANPGCYPTGAILALAPAIKAGIIGTDIIIDSKSGVSGAGRTLALPAHFSEANEDVAAYSIEGHRHLPEIVQELNAIRPGFSASVSFLPHLIPMTRGIFTTAYAPLVPGKIAAGKKGAEEVHTLYADFYRNEPFVKVTEAPPHTKHTSGSNYCLVFPAVDHRTGRLVVLSCIDNLVKGAAGQAIQNMNLMLGFPETTGLRDLAICP